MAAKLSASAIAFTEELDTLRCIYNGSMTTTGTDRYRIVISGVVFSSAPLNFEFWSTDGYPSIRAVSYNLTAPWLSSSAATRLKEVLNDQWKIMNGEPCIYAWVEWLRENVCQLFAIIILGKLYIFYFYLITSYYYQSTTYCFIFFQHVYAINQV